MTHFKRPIALTLLTASLALPAAFAATTPATQSLPPATPIPVTAAVAQTPPVADPLAQAPVANTPATPATPAIPATSTTPATPAVPATPATPAKLVTWATVDANADGSISKDEAAADANLSTNFDMYDKNKDGKLSKPEFGKYTADTRKSNKLKSKT